MLERDKYWLFDKVILMSQPDNFEIPYNVANDEICKITFENVKFS